MPKPKFPALAGMCTLAYPGMDLAASPGVCRRIAAAVCALRKEPPVAERSFGSSESIDTRRYLAAIRRDLPLIAALVVGLTVFAFALSLALPKSYSAAARIGFQIQGGGDSATQERNINTFVELITASPVIIDAQEALKDDGIEVDRDELQAAIKTTPVFAANLIEVRASSSDPRRASAYANAIADAFQQGQNATNSSVIESQIRSLKESMNSTADPDLKAQLNAQIGQLTAAQATQNNQVIVARGAVTPTSPDSPKPVRNAVLALFVGLFLGVLLALLRDQLRPRFSSQRELGQFLELPVVASVPELGRRLGVRAAPQALRIEQEAYQSLSAAIRLALPPTSTHVIQLTSSMHAEGKTTVATRTARLLASSGQRTLLISGDLRWPRLDTVLHVEGKRGLSDLLAAQQSGSLTEEMVRSLILSGEHRDRALGGADVLPSGTQNNDAARLLASGAAEPLLQLIRGMGYTYIIVDSTPLLGIADARIMARAVDRMLVVSRLERISVAAALDLRDELARLERPMLGLVVIGGTSEASPYYSGVKFVTPAEGEAAPGVPPGR